MDRTRNILIVIHQSIFWNVGSIGSVVHNVKQCRKQPLKICYVV